MQSASSSAAPIGDMMVVVGDALFGQGRGRYFMEVEAFTVFLALIGTTLSCINTGARVTYAMGKDDEAPEHFGMLHSKNLTPHRAIWTLAIISAVVGCVAVVAGVRRCRRSHRRRHPGTAARLLVERGLHHARQDGGPAQLAAHRHLGLELRDLPAVHAELHHLHRGLSRASQVQHAQAPDHSGVRIAGQPGLHGLLHGRAVHGIRHQEGAAAGAWASRWCGASTAASTSCAPARARAAPPS